MQSLWSGVRPNEAAGIVAEYKHYESDSEVF